MEHNGEFFRSDGYLTDLITDNTIDFIESSGNSPFFVFLSINTPHSPMQIGDEWWSRFEKFSAEDLFLNDLTAKESDKAFGAADNNELVNHTKAAYAMIENIDWNIGRIMKTIRDSDRYEDTVVIFLGDNGSYLIGFLFSIYLIRIHQINPGVSPYFIILLLWYPCFENLFSIIRKKISKILVTDPDNAHLHQLFFLFILRKFRITNKLIANNLTSLIINLYHFCVFFIGLQNLDQTNAQLLLIAINLVVYICLYIFLSKFSKTLQ